MKNKLTVFLYISFFCLLQTSCNTIDVFEKNIPIPENKWHSNFQPKFEFAITDISKQYLLSVVVRHTDDYKYNNIWLNMGYQAPGDTMRFNRLDLQLGDDAKGWEGTGMDDIWEVRKPVSSRPLSFNKTGTYTFSLAQIMRENPLTGMMSIGLRLDKVK